MATVRKRTPKTCPIVREWVEPRGVCDYCGDSPDVHNPRWLRSPATITAKVKELDREGDLRKLVKTLSAALPNEVTTQQRVILEEVVAMNLSGV